MDQEEVGQQASLMAMVEVSVPLVGGMFCGCYPPDLDVCFWVEIIVLVATANYPP